MSRLGTISLRRSINLKDAWLREGGKEESVEEEGMEAWGMRGLRDEERRRREGVSKGIKESGWHESMLLLFFSTLHSSLRGANYISFYTLFVPKRYDSPHNHNNKARGLCSSVCPSAPLRSRLPLGWCASHSACVSPRTPRRASSAQWSSEGFPFNHEVGGSIPVRLSACFLERDTEAQVANLLFLWRSWFPRGLGLGSESRCQYANMAPAFASS